MIGRCLQKNSGVRHDVLLPAAAQNLRRLPSIALEFHNRSLRESRKRAYISTTDLRGIRHHDPFDRAETARYPVNFSTGGCGDGMRKRAQEITALAYINAIHPDDEVDPVDFFFGDRRGSAASAVDCYEIGRCCSTNAAFFCTGGH